MCRHKHSPTHTHALSDLGFVLTVRAGFVDKVAEVEQGGPGSQVLNESLRKRQKTG